MKKVKKSNSKINSDPSLKSKFVTERINAKILDLLKKNPEGLRWSKLLSEIQKYDESLHPKTVNGCVWKITQKYPDKVYKPSKGVFRLVGYKGRK